MFGDLFAEEDDPSLSGIGPSGSKDKSSGHGELTQPSLIRGSTGLAGIANQGATCYLNSLLQTLLLTPEFRESLFDLGQDELGNIADKEKPGSKVRVIPIHLQRLFARLLVLRQRSASTEELTDSFGWTNNEELQQHDVQELSRILCSAIEDSLVGTSGQQLIARLFRGTIVNQIACEECNRISEREEEFLDLTLAVGGYVGVQDTLRAYYVDEEKMEGSNQYRCDRCKKLVNARKGAKIRALPPVLTLSLLRFSYDFVKLERYKETGHYTFPLELDMAPYCEEGEEVSVYELYSVVLHSGSTHGGHYHAYIKDIDNLGSWSEPENELIQLTPDTGSTKDDIIDMKSPQQCLTALLRKHGGPEHVLPVEKLCQVLNHETGVSWNKRFKRQYGTMTKFLRKYNDLFELNAAGTLVHLVDPMKGSSPNPSPSPSPCPSPSPLPSAAGEEGSPRTGSPEVPGTGAGRGKDQSRKEQAIAKATASLPDPGQCWYDFNDSNVQPIRENALYRQYQGRESAYMLLYRRKTMQRPQGAFSNPYHNMPAWLVAELETANQELERQREEYDRKINSVELHILLAPRCTWRGGALHPLAAGEEPLKVTLDRRRKVAHLMELLKEQVPELVPQLDCLHIAKELPAGFHLLDCITDDAEKTLQDCYVGDGSCLFLWDGKQVNGNSILTGLNCEPILLILAHTMSSSSSSRAPSRDGPSSVVEIPHGFPKDTRISALRCMVADIVGIPACSLQLSRVQSTPVVLKPEDDARTLSQLGFTDGDKLTAESTGTESGDSQVGSLAHQEADRLKLSLTLAVENRCVDPNAEGDWAVTHINILKDKTVSEMKQQIINSLGLYGNQRPKEGCRLRISDNALGLLAPLHESQNLTDAGIKQGKTIVIEAGQPPASNELTVNFTMMEGTNSWDVLLDKKITLAESLTKMLDVAGLSDSFHLRKTNWCGEAADIITDMDKTLSDLHIQDGELLMLEAGRLPPKGFLLLPIWLYPPPPQGTAEEGSGAGSWIPNVQFSNILNSITNIVGSGASPDIQEQTAPQPSTQHELLGEMEICQDATVGDLRGQVMTLPAMAEVVVPTEEFLRLRLLEDGRLGRVLRDANQSLKYAKVNSSSQIAIQILPGEEKLRQNQFVLTVQKRVPDSQVYGPAQELIWEAGRIAGQASLRQAIADLCLLPVERVAFAKHHSKKHEWIVIPQEKKVTEPGRGRGGGGGKRKGKGQMPKVINLRQAPYNLRDGDVFGVVDLQYDPFMKDDFTTIEDERGKERLQKEEEEKKKKRRDRRNAISMGERASKEKSKRRQEVGLTIKVDDFR